MSTHKTGNVSDLASIEIYADRVIVSSELRFPGTDVTIYARVLEFGPGGKVDTTPVQFSSRLLKNG